MFIGLCIKTCNNTMLYAVLFIQLVCKYAGVGVGNLFFFSGGERWKEKALLQTWVLVWVKRYANVLFLKRWVFVFVL